MHPWSVGNRPSSRSAKWWNSRFESCRAIDSDWLSFGALLRSRLEHVAAPDCERLALRNHRSNQCLFYHRIEDQPTYRHAGHWVCWWRTLIDSLRPGYGQSKFMDCRVWYLLLTRGALCMVADGSLHYFYSCFYQIQQART